MYYLQGNDLVNATKFSDGVVASRIGIPVQKINTDDLVKELLKQGVNGLVPEIKI